MAGACYLLIANRAASSGAGDALYIKLVPWVVLAMFADRHAWWRSWHARAQARTRYADGIGRFDPTERGRLEA